jgi:alkylhydroperoxidase family enzyme
MTREEIQDARFGTSSDPQTDAILQFVGKVVEFRGKVSDEDVAAFLAAGFDHRALAEVMANVALSMFTNYFNHVADTDVDFPRAEALEVIGR